MNTLLSTFLSAFMLAHPIAVHPVVRPVTPIVIPTIQEIHQQQMAAIIDAVTPDAPLTKAEIKANALAQIASIISQATKEGIDLTK